MFLRHTPLLGIEDMTQHLSFLLGPEFWVMLRALLTRLQTPTLHCGTLHYWKHLLQNTTFLVSLHLASELNTCSICYKAVEERKTIWKQNDKPGMLAYGELCFHEIILDMFSSCRDHRVSFWNCFEL